MLRDLVGVRRRAEVDAPGEQGRPIIPAQGCRASAGSRSRRNGANDGAGSPPPTNDQQIVALHMQPGGHGVVAMIGINIALEPLEAVRRQALGELAQRAEAACVPVPNILLAAVVGVADAGLKL